MRVFTVRDLMVILKGNKSTIGTPIKCVKFACKYIHKAFTNYLTNRQQYVSLADMESSRQTVICGVPQDSSLGPLLFLIYINDIPNCSEKLSFRNFADDTNIFASSSNATQLET